MLPHRFTLTASLGIDTAGTHSTDTAAQALLLAISRLRHLGHDADDISALASLALGRPRVV